MYVFHVIYKVICAPPPISLVCILNDGSTERKLRSRACVATFFERTCEPKKKKKKKNLLTPKSNLRMFSKNAGFSDATFNLECQFGPHDHTSAAPGYHANNISDTDNSH